MSPYSALRGLRMGCVQYLNARPLICDYPGAVYFDHPARLAEQLARDELDAALVPTFELLRSPHYRIADGVSISSRGAVFSVFLAYRGQLEDVKRISLDPASQTSVYLLRCMIAEYHDFQPEFSAGEGDAKLLIGNQAIDFRKAHGAEYTYLDLGEEWTRRTSLPFVYAMWLLRPALPDARKVADAFRHLKTEGLSQLEGICAKEKDRDFCRQYLTGHIRYELGIDEKFGIEKFRELLMKHELLPRQESTLQFV